MTHRSPGLPIDAALAPLKQALAAHRNVVLQAPPGAGKTTRVPLALLGEPWLQGQRIVLLEPRRLAARLAAHYMAGSLGEKVGATVGYRMRLDTRVGPQTRIEVITEGVLTRMLQADPALEGVGLVIFDEFHERSLHGDLGLALCLDAQQALRDDLRLLVMSATLDAQPVAALLNDAPIITSEGRSYPVTIRYQALREDRLDRRVALAIQTALREEGGSILVFLPGVGEIRQVAARLAEAALGADVSVAPLYANLTVEEQERAIAPAASGQRKVVLATSIAETSLTIEGIRIVIDAGWRRVPRFDPVSGMTRLATIKVTQASAAQRCGRAGRLEPGVCVRLWSEHAQQSLLPHSAPEILETDLAPLVLELAQWGARDPGQLRWLTPPPAASVGQARDLLMRLGAIGADGRVTAHGRAVLGLGLHPRLAHMVLRAVELGWGTVACDLAALLSERDVLRFDVGASEADVAWRVRVLRGGGAPLAARVDSSAVRRVRASADALRQQLRLGRETATVDDAALGVLLALAYPDRIGQLRPNSRGRFRLSNGRGAVLPETDPLSKAEYLVAAELDGEQKEARVFLAAPVRLDELLEHCAEAIIVAEVVGWDEREQAAVARCEWRLGELVLRQEALRDVDTQQLQVALLGAIRAAGLQVLPWTDEARGLRARIALIARLQQQGVALPGVDATWPDVGDSTLMNGLDTWLGPYLTGVRRLDHLARVDLAAALRSLLSWKQSQVLDELAPTHLAVPSGSRIAIDYTGEETPILAVRLQEMFGLRETPRIAAGRLALKLHLLSPAHRPVQVTQDLASFWANTYLEVKKDLKGRYPKHYWPDDPLQAEPRRGVRR